MSRDQRQQAVVRLCHFRTEIDVEIISSVVEG
jgi:hypothetical protein